MHYMVNRKKNNSHRLLPTKRKNVIANLSFTVEDKIMHIF